MKIIKLKKAEKFLFKLDNITKENLEKNINGLLNWQGDIKQIIGTPFYRLKIKNYRIAFILTDDEIIITLIGQRENFYKKLKRSNK